MNKTQNNTPKGNVVSDNKATKLTIKSLIADLASKDGVVRVKPCQQLVAYKKQSVAPLIRTLSNENDWVRWEAALDALIKKSSPCLTHNLEIALLLGGYGEFKQEEAKLP
jgi:HEAT repeat protein